MRRLERDELYRNLCGFLKTRGIELKEGSYAQSIQKSCRLLSDAINVGQAGLERARAGVDAKLGQMRQVIHERTAPKRTRKTGPAAASTAKSAAHASAIPRRRRKRASNKTGP